MEGKPASTIIVHFAIPLWQQFAERGLLGKPYVRTGPMFRAIGYLLFQTGGLLGYGLTGYPELLAKFFLLQPTEDIGSFLEKEMKPLAVAQLSKLAGKRRNFHNLYTVPELAATGIDLTNPEFVIGSKAQWVKQKIKDPKAIEDISCLVFLKGAYVGFFFPEDFRECWEGTYRRRAQSEWRDAYERGLVSSPAQPKLSLRTEVKKVLRAAAEWARSSPTSNLSGA